MITQIMYKQWTTAECIGSLMARKDTVYFIISTIKY